MIQRNSLPIALRELATVTVAFHPDPGLLAEQLAALDGVSLKVIVDNGSDEAQKSEMLRLADSDPAVAIVCAGGNIGLAAALNLGVDHIHAVRPDIPWVMLLDQDSVPEPGAVRALLDAMEALTATSQRIGCIGPALRDVTTGLFHGFHQMSKGRWRRVYPLATDHPVECANINGSGTLMSVALYCEMGGLKADLFIDHVDTEWAFRLRSAGCVLYGVPAATFAHRMGDKSFSFWWFGRRVWPHRSPLRHFYLFRNAAWLARRSYVPRTWKAWMVAKLALTMLVHALFDSERRQQLGQMWSGLRASKSLGGHSPRLPGEGSKS